MDRKIVEKLMREKWGGKTTRHKMTVSNNDNNFWGQGKCEVRRAGINQAVMRALVLDIPAELAEPGLTAEEWAVETILEKLSTY